MSSGLVAEIELFSGNFHKLQKLFSETKLCLDQIDYNRNLDEDLILNQDDETAFKRKLDLLPRFLILGSCQFSKASVVNDLLAQPILPAQIYEGPGALDLDEQFALACNPWRSIRIKYGEAALTSSLGALDIGCPMISRLSLIDVVRPSLERSISHRHDSSSIASSPGAAGVTPCGAGGSIGGYDNSSLESSGDAPQPIGRGSRSDSSVLEVSLTHELLSGGADVFIPADRPDRRSFRDSLREITCDVLPLIVFVLGHSINEKDAYELAELRTLFPASSVFFVRCPGTGGPSELPESERYSPPPIVPRKGSAWSRSTAASWIRGNLFNRSTDDAEFDGASGISINIHDVPSNPFHFLTRLGYFAHCKQLPRSTTIIGESSFGGPTAATHSPHDSDAGSVRSFGRRSTRSESIKGKGPAWDTGSTTGSLMRRKALMLQGSQASAPPPTVRLKSYYLERSAELMQRISGFSRAVLTAHCVTLAASMHAMHTSLLNAFILTAFDMARDQMITPKRIKFARSKEAALYGQLLAVTQQQQDQIQTIIHRALLDMRSGVVQSVVTETPEYPTDFEESTSSTASSCSLYRDVGPLNSVEAVETFVLRQLNQGIAERLSESFRCLRVTFIDTITRCLSSLESMESTSGSHSKETKAASEAFKEILNATYSVEITVQSGRSFLQMLWEKVKQAVSGPPRLQASVSTLQLNQEVRNWKRKVASDVIDNLSEVRLARSICSQLRDRIKLAHDNFHLALDNLDIYHQRRLSKAEDQHLRLRKQHAPRMARLTMESLAFRDVLLQGMPLLGPEVGRGQYGVVYACERWGSNGPCAVKSVVPPDDKHWNDLALEFFYTKNLPEHKRIVRLHGAVIDHNYGGGGIGMGAVLLIMERLKRDLYTGIRVGLPWPARLRVAIDVVEGIRFLHSQGLVHRDIKLKNVLLDDHNRGKITDLGFCKPEAMMSGSIVGTPIHMAPELFSGHYDASVDVYAFGILFWYICAGHVRLPQAFEACASKDQLWNSVRKGMRPERLKVFEDEGWDIMQSCWSGDPAARPHLGNIQPKLERLLIEYKAQRQLNSSVSSSFTSKFKIPGRATVT